MTPLALMAAAAEVADRYGPSVVSAWNLIAQTLRAEHPALNEAPVPDAGAEMDQARADAIKREQAAAIRNAFPLQDDPDATEDPDE